MIHDLTAAILYGAAFTKSDYDAMTHLVYACMDHQPDALYLSSGWSMVVRADRPTWSFDLRDYRIVFN